MPRSRRATTAVPALAAYRARRRFDRTPEPPGDRDARARRPRRLSFVVHKHRARSLHYDLRLEWNGVLLSWAVPKGPTLEPEVRRLAVATEPHPLDYRRFEGVIPAGEYGAGTMMIWDRGTWTPRDPDVESALAAGVLEFALHGEKLCGRFGLVRTGPPAGLHGAGRSWLFQKRADREASRADVLEEHPRSVVSNRLLVEIALAGGGDPVAAATGDPGPALRKLWRRVGSSALLPRRERPAPRRRERGVARSVR